MSKTGLVLEGGAMRGLYTAAVLDVMSEQHLQLDGMIGVSAGATFGCNFKSDQPYRTLRYNLRFCKNWHYASWRSWLLTGDLYGAKFCYDDIPHVLDPFDSAAFAKNPMEFYVVCTDMKTGKAVYHPCRDGGEEDLKWIRASASLPVFSRPVEAGGMLLSDGGTADSIPVRWFEAQGYERQVVILTQPQGFRKQPYSNIKAMKAALHRYPELGKALEDRYLRYNETLDYIAKKEAAGMYFVLRPSVKLPVGPVVHDPEKMNEAYAIGRRDIDEKLPLLKRFLAPGNG